MKYRLAAKALKLTDKNLTLIETHVLKLDKLLPTLQSDLVTLDIKLDQIKTPPSFSVRMNMIVPKKPLIVTGEADSIESVIREGFSKLLSELKKYKGKHFKSNSEYPDKKTIRNHTEETMTGSIELQS